MYIVYIFVDIKHIRSTTVVYEQLDKVCRGEGMERKVWGALGVDLKEGVASF
jgi:hypothetical protein